MAPPRLVSEHVDVEGRAVFMRARDPRAPLPQVVLVHGLSVSSQYLVPLAEELLDDFMVYAPDLPGFGRSDAPPRAPLDVPGLADALRAWMDAVGLERPALVANSLGCQVIAELAAAHPSRVGALALVGPTMDPDVGAAELAWRLLVDATREDPSLLGVHLADDVRAGPHRAWATFRAALRHDMSAALGRVRAPTLVVRGARDPVVGRAWAARVAKLAHGEYVEVPDAPHAANYSAPEPLARALRPFLHASADVEVASARRGGA